MHGLIRKCVWATLALSGVALATHYGIIVMQQWGGRFANYTMAQDEEVDFEGATAAWHTFFNTSASRFKTGDTWDFKYVDGVRRLALVSPFSTIGFGRVSRVSGSVTGGGSFDCSPAYDGLEVTGRWITTTVCTTTSTSCADTLDFLITGLHYTSRLMCNNR